METLHNLGLAYDSKGDYDRAIEDYTGQPSGQACFFLSYNNEQVFN